MRRRDCIVCESRDKQTLAEQEFRDDYLELIDPAYQRERRRLVVCGSCGFVYHDPQIDERDIAVLYERFRDSSFRSESPDAYFDRITSLSNAESENFAKVTWLRERLPELLERGGSLLDIGCGGGVFIHTFLENCARWTGAGVEPTPAFAELAGRRLGQPVVAGSYRPGLFAPRRFDLVTINQVLEHVVDPIRFLVNVRRDLADGGVVYLEVPDVLDFASLEPTHDRFHMQHLWIFSEASLTNVCRRAGYAVVALDRQLTVRHKRNLVVVLAPAEAARADDEIQRDDPAWVASLRTSSGTARPAST
jgi:SAM-dependent methyltransferase